MQLLDGHSRVASAPAICVTLAACRSGDSTAPSQSAAVAEDPSRGPVKTVRLIPSGGIGFDDLWFLFGASYSGSIPARRVSRSSTKTKRVMTTASARGWARVCALGKQQTRTLGDRARSGATRSVHSGSLTIFDTPSRPSSNEPPAAPLRAGAARQRGPRSRWIAIDQYRFTSPLEGLVRLRLRAARGCRPGRDVV